VALFQYFTASRIGEVAGLQWSRIDFHNRRITIMETAQWDQSNKSYLKLNPHPKNKEARPVHMTNELMAVLRRREAFKIDGNDFVFHVEGSPLNYSTIQVNYRGAQRKAKLPYSGTHILRHGMAKLARQIGGGLDAVVAMTGHKDLKLADHYSKLDKEYQKEVSEKIMEEVRKRNEPVESTSDNVLNMAKFKSR
jgi:integrase